MVCKYLSAYKFVWRQLGVCVFRCVASVSHLFYLRIGEYMRKKRLKKVKDITGIELTPGEPDVCLGNGDLGFECCCDECDYYLLCFPEFDPEFQKDYADK